MAVEVVADRGWVTLVRRKDTQYLEHHGTGERVLVETFDSGEMHELAFTSNDEALLVHPTLPPAMASSLFTHGFFNGPRRPEELELFCGIGDNIGLAQGHASSPRHDVLQVRPSRVGHPFLVGCIHVQCQT